MSSDSWLEVIKTIEPRIEDLIYSMAQGPLIKPSLFQRGRRWNIVLEEKWEDPSISGYLSGGELDARVEWAVGELKKWDVTRTAWDTWQFNNRSDAEKFITFYNLKWTE